MKTALQNCLSLKLSMASVALFCYFLSANAQDKKEAERDIRISNGDTVVNGKKISEIDKLERENLRKELHSLERSKANDRGDVVIRRKDNSGKNTVEKDVIIKREMSIPGLDERDMKVMEFKFKEPLSEKRVFKFDGDLMPDSLLENVRIRIEGPVRFENRTIARNGETLHQRHYLSDEPAGFSIATHDVELRKHPENSQAFRYNTTDKDGISTSVSFRIHEAEKPQFAKITGSAAVKLMDEVKDLTLFPNFSSGKTTLSFQLLAKGAAEVKILDNNLKMIFSDKVSGESFNKQLALPKNGIYYLTIYQNKNWFVRQIVKE